MFASLLFSGNCSSVIKTHGLPSHMFMETQQAKQNNQGTLLIDNQLHVLRSDTITFQKTNHNAGELLANVFKLFRMSNRATHTQQLQPLFAQPLSPNQIQQLHENQD